MKNNEKFSSKIIKRSKDYVKGSDACSSYDWNSGKCLQNPEKYCDYCATKNDK